MGIEEIESAPCGYASAFERAAAALREAASRGNVSVSDAQKVQLYGLYKQATEGDCTKPQPSAFRPVERAKWNAWHSQAGTATATARHQYVLQVLELLPSFEGELRSTALPVETAGESDAGDQTGARDETQAPMCGRTGVAESNEAHPTQTPPPTEQLLSRREPVATLPVWHVVAQLGALMLVSAGLAVLLRRATPMCRQMTAEQGWPSTNVCDMVQSFTPALWFAMGYVLVLILRSRMFLWHLLAGEFIVMTAPRPKRRVQRVRRVRKAEKMAKRPVSRDEQLSEKYQLKLIHSAKTAADARKFPTLELEYVPRDDIKNFEIATMEYPYPLEQTANMFYRRFKEPLPDPANPLLMAIEEVEQHTFEEWNCVFKRRILRFKNAAPYVIKRFANAEFIEYVEDSLLDQRNRILYVHTRNSSFTGLGCIEDFSKFEASAVAPDSTILTQTGRVEITSSSIGFFRSKIETMVADYYHRSTPLVRQYLLERLHEEFPRTSSNALEE